MQLEITLSELEALVRYLDKTTVDELPDDQLELDHFIRAYRTLKNEYKKRTTLDAIT